MPPPLTLELDVVAEVAPPAGLDPDALAPLVRYVLEQEGVAGPWSVAVVLVDDERLRGLHREFMGLDTPTDVMTFPHADADDPAGPRGGDVVISVDRAREQAAEVGQPVPREIRFLVVHGLLHLCGWDDATPEARERMLRRGEELLERFDAASTTGGR